jgi:hypothetical protein
MNIITKYPIMVYNDRFGTKTIMPVGAETGKQLKCEV